LLAAFPLTMGDRGRGRQLNTSTIDSSSQQINNA